MVPDLPGPFFDGVDEPGFLLRSTIGTGLPVDIISRMFRDHTFILEGFEVELTYIDWGEWKAFVERDPVVMEA